jgi:mevalonate kinase
MVRAFAPGKCILFGEHAVVYGHPAVAIAIEQGVNVSIEKFEEWVINGKKFERSRHPHISHILYDLFEYKGAPLKIKIESGLFPAAGLGSSAALSNAMGAALHKLIKPQEKLDLVKLAKIGHSAEAAAQEGRASPTDTATSALGGCIVVSEKKVNGTKHVFDAELMTPEGKRNWIISKAKLPEKVEDLWLILGFTGESSSTGKMVSDVANLLTHEPDKVDLMNNIKEITYKGLKSLALGDFGAVGIAMNECHEQLRDLGVSSNSLDRLVEATKPYSLGAKMTGAGGGGCMVALSRNPQRVSEQIEIAGGTPMVSKLVSEGVRLV